MSDWKPGPNAPLGLSDIVPDDAVTTTKIGTIAKWYDDIQGVADFIYLPGVASLKAGDIVAFDLLPGSATVARLTTALAVDSAKPLAVAVAAIGAGQYGWFQLTGVAILSALAGTVAGPAFTTTTNGSVSSVPVAGCQISGLHISSALGVPASGQVYATMMYPSCQTQIT